ncbi:protein LAZY 1-like [Actinidia eriantha]|uniref:protein LAZY 1-like n=1 Tax=Actinidia eriantha TaxID=165200 RepID=UPI00258499D3|nr:protein LAZY 1-like [Actinidia eriantha]
MKLLCWMHRKLRQNSVEPFKESTTGNSYACLSTQPSLYEQEYCPEPTFSWATPKQPQGGCQKSPSELKSKNAEEVSEEESSIMITAPFDGFLMIGTFGSDAIITEPSTPTFHIPFEKITEKETEVTENELKFINDELEKFLEAEAKEVGDESSESSSHVGIITICGNQIEGVDTEDYGDNGICPLQGYLFGSSIELPETNIQVKKDRTSLGQLFKMNKKAKCEELKNHTKRRYATGFIRKMLTKFHSSPTPKSFAGSAAESATTDPASTKRKLPKVLRMFHKKVHPERSNAEVQFNKSHICQKKKNSIDAGYNTGALAFQDKYNRSPLRSMLKKEITNLNKTQEMLNSSGLNQKREHWIRTDADYLVLEL